VVGGESGDGFDAGFAVAGEGARVLVSALRLKQHGGDSFFAEVCERRVPELVERGAATGLAEQLPGHLIRQPAGARVRAPVSLGGNDVGLAAGDEHWSTSASVEVAG
jgi:hypothetical protein